jgi:hypothetical protein
MLFTEFNLDDALQIRAQESWQSGFEQGEEIGVKKAKYQIVASLLGFIDDKSIAEKTGLTINEVEGLRTPRA